MIRLKKMRPFFAFAAVLGTVFILGCAEENKNPIIPGNDEPGPQCLTPGACNDTIIKPKPGGGYDTSVVPVNPHFDTTYEIIGTDTVRVIDTVYIPQDTSLIWVGQSALRITEIAPLNTDWLDENGDDPSWVEIYNSGDKDIDLKGYTLVENMKNLRKWVFGSYVLKAKSFLVVFCDKKNISAVQSADLDGGRHTRPHTNWKLDKNGGTIYLIDKYNGIRDSVEYPELTAGLSWGIVDGGYWKYFEKPTPEKPNTASKAYDDVAPEADMSGLKSGFYSEPFKLNPPALDEGVKLRCTTARRAPFRIRLQPVRSLLTKIR